MNSKNLLAVNAFEPPRLRSAGPGAGRMKPLNGMRETRSSRWLLLVGMVIAAVLSFPLSRVAEAADGDLDAAFGQGGLVTTDFFNDTDEAHAAAIQSDGRIVVAGITRAAGGSIDFAVARYNPDGSLDQSFGSGGKVATDFANTDDIAFAVAIQGDGRIVVAGYSETATGFSDMALSRYLPDGSLDLSFGSGGKVLTDFANDDDAAFGVAIQSDGKIVVAGRASAAATSDDFALARYNADGSLDATFGLGGKVMTDFADNFDQANAVVLQSDGRIVAAGYASDGGPGQAHPNFALARYQADGSLDAAFGTGGKVITDFANQESGALAVTLQDDGRIVAAGSAFDNDTFLDFAVARYNANGSLDTSFDGDGKVTTDFAANYEEVNGMAIQGDGKIVVVGFAGADFGLARYNTDGSLDSSFGAGGKVVTDFEGRFDLGLGMTLQRDGKIVAVGRADIGATGTDFGLARYLVAPTVTVLATDASAAETGDSGTVTFTRTCRTSSALVVHYTLSGTAINGSDYQALSGSVTIPAGSSWVTVAVTPIDDSAIEGSETVIFALSPNVAYTVGDPARATIVIADNDQPPHKLRFYLHGNDIPGTAGGFTMNQTPAPSQTLGLKLLNSPSWFSQPTLTGTFQSGAAFKVVMPGTLSLSLALTFRLAATNPDGSAEQVLGQTTQTLGLGLGPRTISIPVATPVSLAKQRLKLTISSSSSLNLNLQVGDSTFMEAAGFIGSP